MLQKVSSHGAFPLSVEYVSLFQAIVPRQKEMAPENIYLELCGEGNQSQIVLQSFNRLATTSFFA
jgi:hypothetical protein